MTNDDGRDGGRFGSCTGGGRSIDQSPPGLWMPCMFAGIRGCGEWIAPIAGCEADCGVPAGGGYEKGECWMGGGCVLDAG